MSDWPSGEITTTPTITTVSLLHLQVPVRRFLFGRGGRQSENMNMGRSAGTVVTVVGVVIPSPLSGILARFSQEQNYESEERAAIREFDGGFSRADAEMLA